MIMKKKINAIIILFFLAAGILAGCGKVDNGRNKTTEAEKTDSEDNSRNPSGKYTSSRIVINTGEGNKIKDVLITQDAIFYATIAIKENITSQGLYRISLSNSQGTGMDELSPQDAERMPLPENTASISKLFPGDDGSVYLLGSMPFLAGETGRDFIAHYDRHGSLINEYDITESLASLGGSTADSRILITTASAGKDQIVYLGYLKEESMIVSADREGKVKSALSLEAGQVISSAAWEDGVLYGVIQGKEGTRISMVDLEKGQITDVSAIPQEQIGGQLFSNGDGCLLYSGKTGLFERNPQSGELMPLYEWHTSGISGEDVRNVCMRPGGVIDAAVYDISGEGDLTLLRLTPGSSETERETITIGCFYDSQELLKLAGQFNTEQNKYNVEIRTYSSEEQKSRMESEIVSGSGPDLIDLNCIYVKEYVNKGLLENLHPYLEDSQSLKREELVESVLRVNTVENILTCIPSSFMIDILAGKASEIGSRDTWTIEEFQEYLQLHEGAEIYEGVTYGGSKELIVLMDLWARENQYIDWEKKQVYFNTDEFKELLTFAQNYTSRFAQDNTSTSQKLLEGRVLLYNMGIRNMEEYIYQKGLFNGDIVHIGYPGPDKKSNYGIMVSGAYGILSNSKNKEGAWSFIEYMIRSQSAEELPYGQFPVLSSALEEHFRESCVENSYLDVTGKEIIRPKDERSDGGVTVEIYAADQTDVDMVRKMIENISYVKFNDSPVTEIVLEEITSLFTGAKSVEDTSRIIQNRVQLYVNETAP